MEAKLSVLRAKAVQQFMSFERFTHSKSVFAEVQRFVHEYFDQQHVERVLYLMHLLIHPLFYLSTQF